MSMNNKKAKIKAIADYVGGMMGVSPEELGDENIYYKAAEDVLENKPGVWQDTMIWLRLINRQINHLDSLEIVDGRIAILAYMGKYELEHPGEKSMEDLIEVFYNSTQPTVIDARDLEDFDKFFEYPCRIELTPAAHREIIGRILHDKMPSKQIDFYLGTEESSEFGYSKLYPALKHILLTTSDEHLFWTASDVLAIIWRLLPDSDKEFDSWFNKELYDIFWSRAKDNCLRLLASERMIYSDSFSWVINNPDCKKLNSELWGKLEDLAKDEKIGRDDVSWETVFGQICNIRTDKMTPAEKFDFVAKYYQGEELYDFFSRPETIEEAKVYLEKAENESCFSQAECTEIIWNNDDPRGEWWFTKTLRAIEILLAEPLEPKVQEFILEYVVEWFSSICRSHDVSAMRLLWAACSGAVEQSKAREQLAEKCRELLTSQDEDTTPIDAALKLAQGNIAFRTFQTDDLVKNLRKYAEMTER